MTFDSRARVGFLAAMTVVAVSCAAKPPPPRVKPDTSESSPAAPKGHVCAQIPTLSSAPEPIDETTAPIVRVEVRGAKTPEEVCAVIHSQPGASTDDRAIDSDLRRIWALGDIDDIVVARELAPGGVALAYEVKNRQRFISARIDGARTAGVGRDEDYLPDPGPLDPVRVHESVAKLVHALADQGFRHAKVETHTEPRDDDGLELVLAVNLGVRSVVRNITFPGADPSRAGELLRLLASHAGAPLLGDAIERDGLVVTGYYFDHGMLNVRVHPAAITESPTGDALDVAINVDEGPVFKLGNVKLTGDLLDREADYKKRFWSSAPAAVFNRSVVAADIERIRDYHRSQGFNAEVTVDTEMKADKKLIDISIQVKKQ